MEIPEDELAEAFVIEAKLSGDTLSLHLGKDRCPLCGYKVIDLTVYGKTKKKFHCRRCKVNWIFDEMLEVEEISIEGSNTRILHFYENY